MAESYKTNLPSIFDESKLLWFRVAFTARI